MALSTNTHSLAQLPALRLLAHRALTGYDLAVTHLETEPEVVMELAIA